MINNLSCNLNHAVVDDRGICLTCGLAKDIRDKLDDYNKRKIPASKRCSDCPERIDPNTRFMNFVWGRTNISTICESCRIKFKQIRKSRKSKQRSGDSIKC